MAEPINLNRARKAKAAAEAKARAAVNRVAFGRTKLQKVAEALDADRAQRTLDGARRDEDQNL